MTVTSARLAAVLTCTALLAACGPAATSPASEVNGSGTTPSYLPVVFLAGKLAGPSDGDEKVRDCLERELAAAARAGTLTEKDAWGLALDSPLASAAAESQVQSIQDTCL